MFIQSISKKRVAAAIATLGITGAGLVVTGFGTDSNIQVKAGKADKAGEPHVAAAAAGTSDDAVNGDRVRFVARHTGGGRFTIERVVSAVQGTDTATVPGFATTDDITVAAGGAANGSTANESDEQPSRPSRVRVPRTIEVGLPSYDGGRPPSATAPSVDHGTAPSVDPGWTTTIDLGEAPHVGAPSVDPGESGTFHPPTVTAS